jgi:hypothetical protein
VIPVLTVSPFTELIVNVLAESVLVPDALILIALTLTVDVAPKKLSTVIFLLIGEPNGSSITNNKSSFVGTVNAVNCVTFLSAIFLP